MNPVLPSDAPPGCAESAAPAGDASPACVGETLPQRSVVIPVYNGAETIVDVVAEILATPQGRSLEIVLVNDGSADQSERVCRGLVERFPGQITFVQLSHNNGEQRAVLTGLMYCRGRYVAIVDDDGQHPAGEMERLFEAAESGHYDVVFGRYLRRRHPWHRRLAGLLHDRSARWLFNKPPGMRLSSFKVLNRFLVDRLCEFGGPFVNIDAIVLRLTPRATCLDVLHRERLAGRSGYSYEKLLGVWMEALLGFSPWPHRAAMIVGGCTATLAGALSLANVVLALSRNELPRFRGLPGIFVLLGAILFYLGLLGEAIVRWNHRSGQPTAVRYVFRRARQHGP